MEVEDSSKGGDMRWLERTSLAMNLPPRVAVLLMRAGMSLKRTCCSDTGALKYRIVTSTGLARELNEYLNKIVDDLELDLYWVLCLHGLPTSLGISGMPHARLPRSPLLSASSFQLFVCPVASAVFQRQLHAAFEEHLSEKASKSPAQ